MELLAIQSPLSIELYHSVLQNAIHNTLSHFFIYGR
nr:MAG TPA: hypothetical protein [Bacteriophage sp.]